jgi:drug/metabolite transporter (DMT)-like permease
MTNQNKAYLFALLAVLCWSTVASAFKLTLRQVDYLTMLLYASCVSTIFLFVTLMAQGKAGLLMDALSVRGRSVERRSAPAVTHPAAMHRASEGNLRGRALLRSAVNGFLNPFLYYVVLFKAYSLLPAQEAQPLNFTWPIVLVFLSAPMLGQRVRPLSILALGLSFLGVLIVSTHGHLFGLRFTNLPGAILAIGSAAIWALFWLTNVKDERDAVLKLFLNFYFGFLYILVTTLILGLIRKTGVWTREGVALTCVGPTGLLGCVYIGIFEMGAAFVLWLKALQLSEATAKVSNLIFLSPFISLIFIRFVAGERILPSSIIGLGLIAGGILIQRTVHN